MSNTNARNLELTPHADLDPVLALDLREVGSGIRKVVWVKRKGAPDFISSITPIIPMDMKSGKVFVRICYGCVPFILLHPEAV